MEQIEAIFNAVLEGNAPAAKAGVAAALEGGVAADKVLKEGLIAAMAEVGIDITDQTPTVLDPDTAGTSDVIVTMGCGDTCPYFPGVRYQDWELPDPAGLDVAAVRPIRDAIRGRVTVLLDDLLSSDS